MANATATSVTVKRNRIRTRNSARWTYSLPTENRALPVIGDDGVVEIRTRRFTPSGFATKTETRTAIRSRYQHRPLLVEWPDGTVETLHR